MEVLIVEKIYNKGFVIDDMGKIYSEASPKIQLAESLSVLPQVVFSFKSNIPNFFPTLKTK